MIADLKPYPAYRESGSLWLGAVPSHWEVQNLRTLIRPYNERNRTDLPLLSVAREKGVFVRSLTDAGENHNVIPEDLSNYKVARAGNLVINKMKAWQGSMGIAPCDGIVSPAYFVFNFTIANRSFGQALLRSKPYVAHFGQASDGVRVGQWDLTIRGMRQIPILLPPPDEQAAIVRFLGWANGQLEKAIRAKRRVITLLNEQKQVIIHRAVTRGLDPSVLFKPSGIPWLGDIPEHWDMRPIKSLLRETDRRSSDGTDTLLSLTRNRGLIPHSEMTNKMHSAKTLVGYKQYKPGQIVMNRMQAWSGMFGSGAVFGLVSPDYAVFDILGKHEVNFVLARLKAKDLVGQFAIASKGIGSGFNRLYTDRFGPIRITIPPIDEQYSIVAYIDRETSGLNTAISRFEREIELLREYRTRLVADVVTGKLDVRDVAAKLPDEVQALEFEDDLVALEEDADSSL